MTLLKKWFESLTAIVPQPLSNNECERTLYFIDPTRNFEDLARALAQADALYGDDCAIFIPNKNHSATIEGGLNGVGFSIAERLIPYKTVNTNYDTELYREALETSEALFHILQSCRRGNFGGDQTDVPPHLVIPFSISFHDRFVYQIRQILELKEAIVNLGITRLVYFPIPTAMGRAVSRALLLVLPDCDVITTLDHVTEKARKFHATQSADAPAPMRNALNDLPVPRPTCDARRGAILFGTNLRDKQYRKTALPVISELLKSAPVSVIDSAASNISVVFEEFDVRAPYEAGDLNIFEKVRSKVPSPVSKEDLQLMNMLSRRFRIYLDKKSGLLAGFTSILDTYLRLYGLPIIKHFSALEKTLTPHVKVARRVVVTPGRTLESGVLVQIARLHGVPSVEVQSGTISKNHRFTKPQADYILAIESFSKSVYADFMGFPHDRIQIVGGPKLEHDIGPMRAAKQEDVRQKTASVSHLPSDQKIILFASQPVGISKISSVFETLLEGLHRAGVPVVILIKPHPNEDKNYNTLYLELARKWGQAVIIDSQISALEAIVISDLVATYYSTVGLEAFALHRPVIAINPFVRASPYDLAELGVAHEAKDSIVMEFLLETWATNGWPNVAADPSIICLQDGLTMDRTLHMLLEQDLSVLGGVKPELLDGRRMSKFRRLLKLREPAFLIAKLRMGLGLEVSRS